MQKTSYLQSSIILSQLESRLEKNTYFSKENMPSYPDAHVFFSIQRTKKIPNRTTHPYLYHWFIIMKQFAPRVLEVWIRRGDDSYQYDDLIHDFSSHSLQPMQQPNNRMQPHHSFLKNLGFNKNSEQQQEATPRKQLKRKTKNYVESPQNTNLSHKEITNLHLKIAKEEPQLEVNSRLRENPIIQSQYIMELQLNVQNHTCLSILRLRISQQQLEIISFQQESKTILQVVFKAGIDQLQIIKNRMIKWPEVSNIQFRKCRKAKRLQVGSERTIYSPKVVPTSST